MFITGFLKQACCTFGIIYGFGYLIHIINLLIFRKLSPKWRNIYIKSGVVGTTFHELCHAFFCLVFGHKITKINWFTPNRGDGTLGLVSHTYKKKNVYQVIGNFFIGSAPLTGGCALTLLLMRLLLPTSFASVSKMITGTDAFDDIFGLIGSIFEALVNADNFLNPLWYVFLLIVIPICLHMSMSKEDVENSAVGLEILVAALFVFDLAAFLISKSFFGSVTDAVVTLGIYMMCVMGPALVVDLLVLAAVYIIGLLRKINFKSLFSRRRRSRQHHSRMIYFLIL